MTPDTKKPRYSDTVGDPERVDTSPEGLEDHPLNAVKAGEEYGIDQNGTIVGIFSPAEKDTLLKMIKHGEFNQVEAAVLHYLMQEEGSLEDLAVMIGAASPRSDGRPVSKVAAKKKLDKILEVVAKRANLKFGKRIDLSKIKEVKREMRELNALKRKQAKEAARKRRESMKEFWKALKELNAVQRKKGLPVSRYDKVWTQNTASLDQLQAINKA